MTDGVASTTGVDLQIGSQERNQDLVLAGARWPGTPGKTQPEDIRFERRIGRMADWFLDELLETRVMLESSAARRVAARSTRRGLGSCDVRNCFFASVDLFSDPSPWDVKVGNGNAWP